MSQNTVEAQLKSLILQTAEDMEKPVAAAMSTIILTANKYAQGDAMAGLKIQNISSKEMSRIEERLSELGSSVELTTYMSLVEFVSNPDTDNEELNQQIKEL